ncbi:MAG: hypothetical protein ACM3SQ_16405 [Betaproteobacteria bacterium]
MTLPLAGTATISAREVAIARTVIYAGLFDYPLTLEQVRESLIEMRLTDGDILDTWSTSVALPDALEYRDGYFFQAGRGDLVAERRRREARSLAFLEAHRRLLRVVAALPYVRLVALSGSIAHLNLDERGDLDLFVITRGARVWSVTVAVVLLAKLLGRRRTVCLNFAIADTRLEVRDHDLFTANQILHLKPLAGAPMFAAFVAANPFVQRFYPSFSPADAPPFPFSLGAGNHRLTRALEWLLAIPSLAAEPVCRRAYAWYLRRRAAAWTSPDGVRLEPDAVKLHTASHRRTVLERFDAAVGHALHPPFQRAAGGGAGRFRRR